MRDAAREAAIHIDALAEACRALIGTSPTPMRMAQADLQPRNAHPASLQDYEGFFGGRATAGVVQRARAAALPVLGAVRREPLWAGDEMPERADILFMSHFTSKAQAAQAGDSYFGFLPAELQKQGLKPVVCYLNHTWLRNTRIPLQGSPVPRVILGRTLSHGAEAGLARQLRKDAQSLLSSLPDTASPLMRAVAAYVRKRAPTTAALTALRTARQVSTLVQRLRPRAIVTTFEGHAWERLVYHAVRDAQPGIRCLGYHHTVLFPEQKALATAYGNGFDPDEVLTAGDVTKDWFQSCKAWADRPVHVLGSPRSGIGTPPEVPRPPAACLVAPEGIVSETATLFRLALDAARAAPKQQFLVRLHPVVSRSAVLKAMPDMRTLPANVRWSEGSLEEAFQECSAVLYRGSTVALSAVLAGLRPIYAAIPDEPVAIDPLGDLKDWRLNVENPGELIASLAGDAVQPGKERRLAYRVARDYCQAYFRPLDVGCLLRALDRWIEP